MSFGEFLKSQTFPQCDIRVNATRNASEYILHEVHCNHHGGIYPGFRGSNTCVKKKVCFINMKSQREGIVLTFLMSNRCESMNNSEVSSPAIIQKLRL